MSSPSAPIDAAYITAAASAHDFSSPPRPAAWASSSVALISIVIFSLYLLQYGRKDAKTKALPPGPRGLPIFGSFFDLTAYPELTVTRWQQKYGPLFGMTLGNQLFVVVGEANLAKEIFVTHGKDFASRKAMFIKGQTILKGGGITGAPYGDTWRIQRKLVTTMFDAEALERLTPIFDRETVVICKSLLDYGAGGATPVFTGPHAGRMSFNVMLSLMFGKRTESLEEPLAAQALKLSREYMNCTGAVSNLEDFVPLLQYFPTEMRTRGRKLRQGFLDLYGGMLKEVAEGMKNGDEVPDCMAKKLVTDGLSEGLTWDEIATMAGTLLTGGVETTAAVTGWFLALIPSHPEVQARAHAELDAVVGRDRIPNVGDIEDLPYIRSIIKEVQRIRNPFWLGTPHFSTEDYVTSAGHFIPKGTVVVLNTYAIHHNPERYPEPHTFNPERYIHDTNSARASINMADPNKRDHWAYGAGRRICPGYTFAERTIFLAVSRLLWSFHMQELPEAPIDLMQYDGKSGRSPAAFRIRCIPRHENVASVLDTAQSFVL